MTYMVTGVAGFIGSHLAERLLRDGHTVIGIDNMSTGKQSNISRLVSLPDAGITFRFYQADVTLFSQLHYVFHQHPDIRAVFHQAALGSVPRSLKYPEQTFQANVVGFNNVLNACLEFKVKRLVYASSSSVYGGVEEVVKKESLPPCPLNPYAASKLMNETQALAYSRAFGIETIGLRYFNVFGPHQNADGEYAAVIPKWIKSVKEGKPITIYGDGLQHRDFTYIENVVEANILAGHTTHINRVYNIGTGEPVALNDIYSGISTIAGKKPWAIHSESRPGDVRHSAAHIGDAWINLGYVAKIDWKEGLRRTCESAL